MVSLEVLQQEEEEVTDDHGHDDSVSIDLILELLLLSELKLFVLAFTIFMLFLGIWGVVE
jgi:heme/copper-type cytochrome/quinol oxidase subunit 3